MTIQVGDVFSFKSDNSKKMFQALTTGFYNNRIPSVVRELFSNAVDIHNEIGQTKPFDVFLPDVDAEYFVVRDYGTGLTHEDVVNVFTVFGASTKDEGDIGGFGLGAKTPFIVAEQFIVRSHVGGVTNTYNLHSSQDEPSWILSLTETTGEADGLEIIIPTPISKKDEWLSAVKFYSFNLDVTPNVYASKEINGFFSSGVCHGSQSIYELNTKHDTAFHFGDGFTLLNLEIDWRKRIANGTYVSVKGVLYSVTDVIHNNYDKIIIPTQIHYHCPVIFDCDDLKLQRSREGILNTPENNKMIVDAYNSTILKIGEEAYNFIGFNKFSAKAKLMILEGNFISPEISTRFAEIAIRTGAIMAFIAANEDILTPDEAKLLLHSGTFIGILPNSDTFKFRNFSKDGSRNWGGISSNIIISSTATGKKVDDILKFSEANGVAESFSYINGGKADRDERFNVCKEWFLEWCGLEEGDFNFIFDDIPTNLKKSPKKNLCRKVYTFHSFWHESSIILADTTGFNNVNDYVDSLGGKDKVLVLITEHNNVKSNEKITSHFKNQPFYRMIATTYDEVIIVPLSKKEIENKNLIDFKWDYMIDDVAGIFLSDVTQAKLEVAEKGGLQGSLFMLDNMVTDPEDDKMLLIFHRIISLYTKISGWQRDIVNLLLRNDDCAEYINELRNGETYKTLNRDLEVFSEFYSSSTLVRNMATMAVSNIIIKQNNSIGLEIMNT